jgi:microcystin-dependent protein
MAKLAYNHLVQFIDGNGDPYAGAQLFTYASGSSTKATTYQDSGSSTSHANPIELDANGRIPAAIWLTEGTSYKFVLAPSDDTDPPASPLMTLDGITGINDASVSLEQWADSGFTPTYISATQFSVAGDQTSTLHVGRRVKVSDGGGTKYGYITVSAYTTLTTVTVSLDSGNLETPTSTLYIGVQTTTDPSEPLLTDDYPLRSDATDKTKKVRLDLSGISTASTRTLKVPDHNATLPNFPAGFVAPYAGTTAPDGWLFCYGQAISRTTYADLFTAISTTFGVGDGSTTFNVPDIRGRVIAGKDDMGGSSANRLTDQTGGLDGDTLGDTGGAETHTLTEAQMPAHTHTQNAATVLNLGGSTDLVAGGGAADDGLGGTTASTGGGGAHNNVQPTIILNYCIKT